MVAPARIVAQGEVGRGSPEPPALRLPRTHCVFTDRAARLRALAARGHATAEYLQLMASIAEAQQAALAAHPAVTDPTAERQQRARMHGLPLLGTDGERDPAWRDALKTIVEQVAATAPQALQPMLRRLRHESPDGLEASATDLLSWD